MYVLVSPTHWSERIISHNVSLPIFLQYVQILGTRQMRTIRCAASSNFTVGLDDTVSNTDGFGPRSLPCNANPRCSNLQLGGRTTSHEKGPCHLLKDSEPHGRSNIQAGLELVSGGGTLSRSYCEGGSRKCYSESTSGAINSRSGR